MTAITQVSTGVRRGSAAIAVTLALAAGLAVPASALGYNPVGSGAGQMLPNPAPLGAAHAI